MTFRAAAGLLIVVSLPLAAQETGGVLPVANPLPAHYVGNCPGRIEFVGRLTVTVPGTRVDYRWERSNGDSSKVFHVVVGKPVAAGSAKDSAHPTITDPVPSDFWKVGLPSQDGRFWEVLHVLSPVDISSRRAVVDVECRE